MKPITRSELFMATAAGEYSGELPEPITRQEQYLKKIIEEIDGGGSVSPEQIDAAIEAYLNSHDADIVTEQELSDALAGYYDKDAVDTALNEKQDTLTAGDNISIETVNGELTISATDTTYSDATQQTHGLMSAADKTKLDSITAAKIQAWDAAEQNVNADWNANSGDAQILNKPDLTVYALADDVTTALGGKVDKETGKSLMTADEHTKLNGIETGAQVNTVTGVKGNAESDYRTGEINISPANIGLGNVDNTSDANKPISTATQTALDGKVDKENGKALTDINYSSTEKAKVDGAIQSTEKGSGGGVAELDANGKVPSSQLPSFVDDVMEYADVAHFPQAGESGKIYIAVDTNLSYRWTGTGYAEISPSLALGETSSTAYRGDWGKATKDAVGNIQTLQTDDKSNLVAAINELKSTSVSADPNKGLSSNDFTTALKNKLDGIAAGAEVNVQPDWNQNNNAADDFIKNKPLNIVQDASYVHTDNNYTTEEKTKLGGIESGAEANVQSDWNQSDTTADDFIKNKPTNASASAAGLMSPADFKKINPQVIVANTDLNGITEDGWYYCGANNIATTLSNCPTNHAFYLEVHKHAGRHQHIVEYDTNGAAQFHRNLYSGTWGNWVQWKLTDTTYSAGTGLLLSGTTFSNLAPNVKSDWNAAAGTDAEILNKPTLGAAAAKDVGTDSNQVAAGNHNHTGVYAPLSHSDAVSLYDTGSRVTLSLSGTTYIAIPSSFNLSDYKAIEVIYHQGAISGNDSFASARSIKSAQLGAFTNLSLIQLSGSSSNLSISHSVLSLNISNSKLTIVAGADVSVSRIVGWK